MKREKFLLSCSLQFALSAWDCSHVVSQSNVRLESLSFRPDTNKSKRKCQELFSEVFTTKRICSRLYYKSLGSVWEGKTNFHSEETKEKEVFTWGWESFILKRMKKEKISSDISPKKKESSSKVSLSKGTSNNKKFYFYLDNEECEGGATYRYSADDRWWCAADCSALILRSLSWREPFDRSECCPRAWWTAWCRRCCKKRNEFNLKAHQCHSCNRRLFGN